MNRLKMKTTATLLIAIFMISTLSVISVGAYTANDYTTAVLDAADRLVATQNGDGSFDWQLGQGHAYDNSQGITAMGILKAHEILDKTDYETALAKSYGYMITPITYLAYPDVTYLVWLADAAEADASLLAAIVAEVSGTSVQDIRDRAETIWINRLAYGRWGTGNPGNQQFTATELAEYELGRRGSLGFWDLEAAVKAALTLGLDADAEAIADVMYAHLLTQDPFDIEDTTDLYYALALSGAIEGFSELGVYPTITRTMTNLLIANQDGAGYWDQGGHVNSDEESVQCTSYAVMALLAQGDYDALTSALKGVNWLVSTQNTNGGWCPGYVGATLENLEVDSEAAWAIARARFMVRAIGHFTTNFDYLGSGTGHRCFINLHARQVADGWTGNGIFRDKDHDDGELRAVFIVDSASVENLPRQINYRGTADVYIDKEYQGNYVWESIIAIGEPFEIFSFQIRGQGLDYYAWANGFPSDDVSVEMTLKVLD